MPLVSQMHLTVEPQPTLLFGVDAVDQLAQAVIRTGHNRALIITDHGLIATGIPARLLDILGSSNIEVKVFDAVTANPGTSTLDAGASVARAFGPCTLVAVGGGSSIDVAKGLGIAAVNAGSGRDFDYRLPQKNAGLPLICIPTTAGTGAETNAGEKFYVGNASMMPRYVICDPMLTVGLPPRPTAATGIDALAHAIEAVSAKNQNPIADGLAFEAIGMIINWLPKAVTRGNDIEARSQMLLAAHIAGRAFATGTGLGLAHGIAHPLSARAGSVHGEALAVLLPYVMRFNLSERAEVYGRLAHQLGVADPAADAASGAQSFIETVQALISKLGLPTHLADVGGTSEMIPWIAKKALEDEVTLNAPIFPELSDVTNILEMAM